MAKYELLPERLRQYIQENKCSSRQVREAIEFILNSQSAKFYVKVLGVTSEYIPRVIELEPRNVMSEEDIRKEFEKGYNITVK